MSVTYTFQVSILVSLVAVIGCKNEISKTAIKTSASSHVHLECISETEALFREYGLIDASFNKELYSKTHDDLLDLVNTGQRGKDDIIFSSIDHSHGISLIDLKDLNPFHTVLLTSHGHLYFFVGSCKRRLRSEALIGAFEK
jgi:dipeptidyl aminopeptidase/acylaminoacyl peptidase